MPKAYAQSSPVARTLEVVGERWTILILQGAPPWLSPFCGAEGVHTGHRLKRSLGETEAAGEARRGGAEVLQRTPSPCRVSPDQEGARARAGLPERWPPGGPSTSPTTWCLSTTGVALPCRLSTTAPAAMPRCPALRVRLADQRSPSETAIDPRGLSTLSS